MSVLVYTKPTGQDSVALTRVWEQVQADTCPYQYNFHLHTVYSDGRMTPEVLMEQAFTIGLKGLAITDHHAVAGFKAARKWLNHRVPDSSFQLWTGVEVTSIFRGIDIHLLGYAFDPQHLAMAPYLTGERPLGEAAIAERVIAAIQEAGGLVVLAHPCRYHLPAQEIIPELANLGVNGLEAYYAYGNPKPWVPSARETEQVKQLASFYNLYTTCGTDSHGLSLLQRI